MRGTEDSSYMWAAYPCVYPGVWRCLQECMDGSPLSTTNNIVKIFDWLPAENSCKIAIMRKICLSFVFLMLLGMVCTNELYAQKPLTAMTKTEIDNLSETQIKKGVIKEWSGILTFIMRGVKFDNRIVEAFAENFKEGATEWINKGKFPTVDYVVAEDLVQFSKHYIGRNSCKETVMDYYYENTYPASIDRVMYRIMDLTNILYQKQQAGLLTKTPPEYIDAKTLINAMQP